MISGFWHFDLIVLFWWFSFSSFFFAMCADALGSANPFCLRIHWKETIYSEMVLNIVRCFWLLFHLLYKMCLVDFRIFRRNWCDEKWFQIDHMEGWGFVYRFENFFKFLLLGVPSFCCFHFIVGHFVVVHLFHCRADRSSQFV